MLPILSKINYDATLGCFPKSRSLPTTGFRFNRCIAVARGRYVLQIMEIEKLRFFPTGTFGRTWADFLNEHNFKLFTTGSRRKQLHE
ncbi:hypothetical protein [Nostoc punctiforme]|nr:hypothetical protein [Nostoc punctiforme]